MINIVLTKQAEKSLKKLPLSGQKKIAKAIEKLIENPLAGQKLKGEFEGQYKLYAWPYRVVCIFSASEQIVTIVEIGHRQEVYK